MSDFSRLADDILKDVPQPERKMLAEFLRISAHPTTAPSKVEAHVLTSLALAMRSNQTAV